MRSTGSEEDCMWLAVLASWGYVWLYLAVFGCVRLYLAALRCVRLCLALLGCVRLCMAMLRCVRLCVDLLCCVAVCGYCWTYVRERQRPGSNDAVYSIVFEDPSGSGS